MDGQHKYWLSYKTEKLVKLGPVHMPLLIDYKFFDLGGEMTSLLIEHTAMQSNGHLS